MGLPRSSRKSLNSARLFQGVNFQSIVVKFENPVLKEVGIDHRVACWVDLKTGKARI